MISQTQQAAAQVVQQTEKVKSLAAQKEKRTAKSQALTPKEEQQIVDEEKNLDKFSKLLASMRGNVEKTVSKLSEGRYGRFDACFVRLMEIQVDFFRQGLGQTETFCANIDNYRRRYPRQASSESKAVLSPPTSPSAPLSNDGTDFSSTVEAPKSQDGSEADWDAIRASHPSLGQHSEEEAKKRIDQRRKEAEEEAQRAAKQKAESTQTSAVEEDLYSSLPMGDFLSGFGKDSGVPPTPPSSNDRGIKRGKLTISTELPARVEQAPLSAPARTGVPISSSGGTSIFEELASGPIMEDKLHVSSIPSIPSITSPISPRSPLSPMMPSMDSMFPDAPGVKEDHGFVDFRTDEASSTGMDDVGPAAFGDTVPPTPPPSARGERKHPGLDLAKLSAGLTGLASVQTTPAPVPPTPPPSARGEKPPLASSLNLEELSAGLAQWAESEPMSPSPRSPDASSPKIGAPLSTSGRQSLDFGEDVDVGTTVATFRRDSSLVDGSDDPFSDATSESTSKTSESTK
eukprot:TRINITY_DN4773_c0_g1_i2.p1 TRINITY_DN4773_c0_g1~~TRINITY_DN4773_c0_g1_i2.p1  ORF type:complete len:551 (+),score=89.31 TRINITY_DN4773_c0_g1_i2:111-1655(+)